MRRTRPRHRNAYLLGWSISITAHLLTLIALAILLFPYASREGQQIAVELSTVEDAEFSEVRLSARPEAAEQDESPDFVDSIDMDSQLANLLAGSNNSPSDQSQGQNGKQKGSGTEASFFGTTAYGDRFVYVIDMSGSMSGGRRGKGRNSRFQRAVAECLRSVDKLGPNQSFYVVLFAYKTRRMFDDPSAIPVMVPATAAHKARLRKWLQAVSPSGGTDPREAMFVALSTQPSAVFLLSDGAFNGQQKNRPLDVMAGNPTVEEVVQKHNSAAAPIHTVAYEAPQSKQRLKLLSERTKGEFQYVGPVNVSSARVPRRPTAAQIQQRKAALARVAASKAAAKERLAKDWFAKAQAAEAAGDRRAALLRYRAIIARFPKSKFAGDSQKRIDSVGVGDIFDQRPLRK